MSQQTVALRLPNLSVRQLFHFVVAADAGTLAEAGRALRMAPSAISYSIDQLESELGVQLCIRHKAKGLTLTPSGEAALVRARNMLADLRDFEILFSRQGVGNTGRIIVGCTTPIAPFLLPATHKRFAEVFPDASVEFVEETQSVLQERLLQGDIDLAFMYDLSLDHRIQRKPLLRMTPNLLLSGDHPLAQADAPATIPLSLVADERFVLFGAHPLYDAYLRLFRDAGIEPNIAHTCRSMGTLRAFVGRGTVLGLSYEKYTLLKTVDDIDIVSKPLAGGEDDALTVCVALPRDSRPSTLARSWIEAAEAIFTV
ncbi:LysR family transcriptional regulator [Leucobacter sp. W1038]|uniref:LysR family transcriptional regulator n=1 Tax=Leucobacter sp. W1038 TaxID=3438281 RepID=UPI003D97DA3A